MSAAIDVASYNLGSSTAPANMAKLLVDLGVLASAPEAPRPSKYLYPGPRPNGVYNTVRLEVMKVLIKQELGPERFQIQLREEDVVAGVARKLVCEVLAYCTGAKFQQSVPVPASGWQQIKQDYFPAWLLKLLPVKTRNLELEVTITLPNESMFEGREVRAKITDTRLVDTKKGKAV